ncbi:MAG TPA: DUF4276 family protein [Candidatus Binatia bacterium]|jgi:hypothetical protein|nr:DUF4276 family protein [Candidatus Binatia bacterium]
MKSLVLLGEGHGETDALPILVRKVLLETEASKRLPLDKDVIRFGASRVFRWNKAEGRPDYMEWCKGIRLAARRSNGGGVLAVYDGDFKSFPPGADVAFCASAAARSLAAAAAEEGAGRTFSLAVVFACQEYETWLVAGAESLRGKRFKDGRLALRATAPIPAGDPESHGKRWLEQNCPNYRPTLDQGPLTELLDLAFVRPQSRSFRRFEHAVVQLVEAVAGNSHVSTPA